MAEVEATDAAARVVAEEEAIPARILKKRQRQNTRAPAREKNRAVLEMAGLPSKEGDKGKGNLANLMEELSLKEEDLDDAVFEDDDAPAEEDIWWMILARVHMNKDFSSYWFFRNMKSAWDLARTVKIKTLEENLF
ncbi:hypothetical protein D1007_48499 [Hordeum vulgare]|nr:hypothetical protein D1007_48499 [Hordeum vulgare]